MPANTERTAQGRYLTGGLDEKRFQRVFDVIQKQQAANRRNAKRTLTSSALTKKTAADLAKLGSKENGEPFTKDDLKRFEQERNSHKKRFNAKTTGITYHQLVSGSREIDIKRANNQSDDGRGITKANLSGIRANTVLIRVKASSKSVHENHLVKIRLDEWDDLLNDPPAGNYKQAVKEACRGRISIDCDCGRHQYWYRYLATMGNYCVAPPKEFSYPKIRNPELKGVACKHVLKAAVMLQSVAWHGVLARQMEVQASKIGYADDRKSKHVLTASELKEASKNRSTKINSAKVQAEYRKYKKAQAGLAKKLTSGKKEIEKLRKQANKIRKQANTIKKKDQELTKMRDMLRMSFTMFHDMRVAGGSTKADSIKAFAKKMNVSESKLKQVLK
ncbi:phage tail protein [Photobacterium leiognathi]|uniref:phage tail protein n=1 Tax=Photobacterium leiognathi TaxID=553611 RepID=UPI001EDD20DA|nr:phage tail protein [Photobacterium leiognathi]MCG3884122.1 phage tail protein [Photobacterium leiognathi]